MEISNSINGETPKIEKIGNMLKISVLTNGVEITKVFMVEYNIGKRLKRRNILYRGDKLAINTTINNTVLNSIIAFAVLNKVNLASLINQITELF